VQKYENGFNRISASRLHHIANILNVPPAFFFEGAPGFAKGNSRGPSPNIEIEFLAEGEGRALMQAFQRLPTRDLQRSVIALVEELADR
jgi:transcriptional regulator with XRE-family HTH domain